MFFQIFKYQLKKRLHNKMDVFWSFIFPLILATFFYLSFSKILSGENFEKINVAFVDSPYITEEFKTAADESNLFNSQTVDSDTAISLLSEGKISAYLSFSEDPEDIEITVGTSGINETIVKSFIDQYLQSYSTIKNIIINNPQSQHEDIINSIDFSKNYITEQNNNTNTNANLIPFFALIAMTCMLGSDLGCDDIIHIQANQSDTAARLNICPASKMKIFFATILGTFFIHLLSLIALCLYMTFILKINLSIPASKLAIVVILGCFTGITMGTMLSALIKQKASIKSAILITFTMIGTFLSGMMILNVKYFINKNIPILNYLNPVNLITDGLYSLYCYDTFDKFNTNMIFLGVLGIVFSAVTCIILRRQRYASI